MSRDGICEALTALLRQRTEWDEAPCLYFAYRDDDGIRLSEEDAIVPRDTWDGAHPAAVVGYLASSVRGMAAGAIGALVPSNLEGVVLRFETWGVQPSALPPAEREMAEAMHRVRRLSEHPARIEQRYAWAVMRDGKHYAAFQSRGEKAITARKVDKQSGLIPESLEGLLHAFSAAAN